MSNGISQHVLRILAGLSVSGDQITLQDLISNVEYRARKAPTLDEINHAIASSPLLCVRRDGAELTIGVGGSVSKMVMADEFGNVLSRRAQRESGGLSAIR